MRSFSDTPGTRNSGTLNFTGPEDQSRTIHSFIRQHRMPRHPDTLIIRRPEFLVPGVSGAGRLLVTRPESHSAIHSSRNR